MKKPKTPKKITSTTDEGGRPSSAKKKTKKSKKKTKKTTQTTTEEELAEEAEAAADDVDESAPAQVKTARRKGEVPTFDFGDLKAFLEGKSVRTVRGADGKPTKKKEQAVEILRFVDENVIGHPTGHVACGALGIDKITGVGGFPRGRIIEASGEESTGKTTFAASLAAAFQAMGGVAAIVDVEEKWDLAYVRKLGVRPEDLIVIQPTGRKTFESVLEPMFHLLDYWAASGFEHIPLVLIWDSVGQTPTESEFEKATDEAKAPGEAQKLLKGAVRVLTGRLARAQATLLAVNQVYTAIPMGFAARNYRGPKTITYGGFALRFAASIRLQFVRIGFAKLTDGTVVGSEILVKTVKNSVGVPMREEKQCVRWGVGFDNYVALFWKMKEHGYVTTGGRYYTFAVKGGPTFQFQNGFVGFAEVLSKNAELYANVRELYEKLP